MGEDFRPPNEHNPDGYFEDLEIVRINDQYERGVCGVSTWEENMRAVFERRRAQKRLWGWKDPRTASAVQHVCRMFPKATFVRTRRNKIKVIESLRRCYGFSQSSAEALWRRREGNLDAFLDASRTIEVAIGEDPHVETTATVPKVRVVVPTSGRIHFSVVVTLLGLTGDPRYNRDFALSREKPYDANQNKIVQSFLSSDGDYLLMLDDDNPPEHNPLDLVEADLDVVGFPTPMLVNGSPMWNTFAIQPGSDHDFTPITIGHGLTEVGAVGSGCLLIARRVLEHPDMRFPFRQVSDADGLRVAGADLMFCRRAREAGFRVWAHGGYRCDHWKDIPLKKYCT